MKFNVNVRLFIDKHINDSRSQLRTKDNNFNQLTKCVLIYPLFNSYKTKVNKQHKTPNNSEILPKQSNKQRKTKNNRIKN